MKSPPLWLSLKFHSFAGKADAGFGIYLPLFLLGPLAFILFLAIFLIALPFILLSVLFTWQIGYWRWLFLGVPAFLRILHNLPGLKVDIEHRKQKVYIAIY